VREQQGLEESRASPGELSFRGDLEGFRAFVVDRATRAGVAGSKLAELEWAANEVATNVVRHAGGEARVRTWMLQTEFVCEIADRGPGIKDSLGRHLPPELGQKAPSGLWFVNQLCDLVEMHSSTWGLTVRLYVMLDR
jgi:anti-sigma regulatory factor (Ser/Thr protein kinase)